MGHNIQRLIPIGTERENILDRNRDCTGQRLVFALGGRRTGETKMVQSEMNDKMYLC